MTLNDETTMHMAHADSDISEADSSAAQRAQHCWENMPEAAKSRWLFLDNICFAMLRGILSCRFWLLQAVVILWMLCYWEPQDPMQSFYRTSCVVLIMIHLVFGVAHIFIRRAKTRLFISVIEPYVKKRS